MSGSKSDPLLKVAAFVCIAAAPASAEEQTSTTWSVTPYFWASDTTLDITVQDTYDAVLGYTVGKRQLNRILFGYQYKEAEFKDGGLTTDFTYGGPMAGFNFRF